MNLEMIFRGMDDIPGTMEEYIIACVKKFKIYITDQQDDTTDVHVVVEEYQDDLSVVEIRITSPTLDLFAIRDGQETYQLIDETMSAMEQELLHNLQMPRVVKKTSASKKKKSKK